MAITDRTVSVTAPISDGQAPVYNASQDKFLPTTLSTGAVVAGPSITTPPNATGTRSLVGGSSASDNGNQNAIVLGTSASTTGNFSVVIGDSAAAGVGTSDVAIGFSASGSVASGGGNSVAVGVVATAAAQSSCAIGNGANCASTATSSVAIGTSSHSLGQFDIAVGNTAHSGSTVSQRPSIAIGSGANANFDNAIALGTATVATAIGETACCTINQGVSLINTSYRTNVMSGISPTGVGAAVNLSLADGSTTSITLGATVSPMVIAPTPPTCIIVEGGAQGHDSVSGTFISRAFFQRYAYNYSTGAFAADASNSSAGDANASTFSLTASVTSHNLSIVFNTGTRNGNFTVTAVVRYI